MDQRPSGNLLPGANMTIGFVFQANPNLGVFLFALCALKSPTFAGTTLPK